MCPCPINYSLTTTTLRNIEPKNIKAIITIMAIIITAMVITKVEKKVKTDNTN
jgi:hypothetical protein